MPVKPNLTTRKIEVVILAQEPSKMNPRLADNGKLMPPNLLEDCIIVPRANFGGKNGLRRVTGKHYFSRSGRQKQSIENERECRLVERAPTAAKTPPSLQTSIETVELFNLKIHRRCRSKNI